MFTALALVLAAVPSLSAEDVAARLTAVQDYVKKQKKPLLTAKDARALTGCVELPAVKDSGCEVAAQVCPLHEGDDGSSGTRRESLSLLLTSPDHPSKHLQVWRSAVYEPRLFECDPPEHLFGASPPDQRAKEIETWRASHAKEYAACVARMQKDARDDAEEVSCDVLFVNACRREAYVRCKARNLAKAAKAPSEEVQRFEF